LIGFEVGNEPLIGRGVVDHWHREVTVGHSSDDGGHTRTAMNTLAPALAVG
jgi:hypothetical protein